MSLTDKTQKRTRISAITGTPEEKWLIGELIDSRGGGEPAVVLREALVELALAVHARNSLAPARLDTSVEHTRRVSDLVGRVVRFA
jgi:hypothetical protein